MREHEVPTHVQAEDKVLLWFTFSQIVAVVAVCALAYGAYHYLPFGPMEVRLAVGVLIGMVGIAMTVGKVGGRGLPLVAADLLKFNLGPGASAGSPAQLALSEPPAAPEAKPDPLRLLAKKAASGLGKAVNAARKKGRGTVPAPQLVRQAPQPRRRRKPPQPAGRGWQGKEALEPLPGSGGTGTAGGGPAAQRRPGRRSRRPGLAAGRNLLRAAGPGAGTPHIHRAAGRLRRHRRRYPAGRPRPGPEGTGVRRQAGQDPEDGGQRQPDGRPGQELQPDPERPVAVLHLLLGGRPGPVRGGDPKERPESLRPAPGRRASCATWS